MEFEALEDQYKSEFRTQHYLATYYPVNGLVPYTADILSSLHRIYSVDITEGTSLLDIGCGPTIFGAIPASRRFKNIVFADFLEQNREEVRKWIRGEPDAHDWKAAFEFVAKLEKDTNCAKLEQRVRNSVQNVVQCDLTLANPIAPLQQRFDVVFTSLCYDAIAKDEAMYKKLVANTANLVNDGGFLIIGGLFDCTYYYIGDVRFPSFSYSKAAIDKALQDAKLQTVLWSIYPSISNNLPMDMGTNFLVLAKK